MQFALLGCQIYPTSVLLLRAFVKREVSVDMKNRPLVNEEWAVVCSIKKFGR